MRVCDLDRVGQSSITLRRWHCHGECVCGVCVLGPVGGISMLEYNGSGAQVESDAARSDLNGETFIGTGRDASHCWPVIPKIHQKPPQKEFPYTQMVLLYIGSSTSNRSLEARQRRGLVTGCGFYQRASAQRSE